jgi:hypothetical protein
MTLENTKKLPAVWSQPDAHKEYCEILMAYTVCQLIFSQNFIPFS